MGHQLPDKVRLENHRKRLIVPKVDREDDGKYMCKAKNALGEATHYFTLTVEGSQICSNQIQSHHLKNMLLVDLNVLVLRSFTSVNVSICVKILHVVH